MLWHENDRGALMPLLTISQSADDGGDGNCTPEEDQRIHDATNWPDAPAWRQTMPLLTVSQSCFDEIARAIREAVPADEHDAYFDGGRIDMDHVVLTTEAVVSEARKPPFADYVPSED